MKRQLLLLVLAFVFGQMVAQNAYEIVSGGQGKNGSYLVKVTTTIKDVKKGKDELKRCAVHGVLFRGFMGEVAQAPLVADPNVAQTKAGFFDAFFREKAYERYVALTESSFKSVKVKGGTEVSALLNVDKESLQNYLEESGIIKGFSNLW